ncbi:hypothetical protein [Paramicrobacterium chengjingii]|uniref:hypothetical protein n=1 Tax=Paramicrobacterium chengjingii TaxID=2769067 RepID=UPI0014209D37|nr:hypothetical protein [Microbacterium chengjingii]
MLVGPGDDWYSVGAVDDTTFVISEPKYDQQNNEYVLVSTERAYSGPGKRNIRPIVEHIVPRGIPVTVIASHSHYDHIGERPIEITHLPGHTAGSIGLIDHSHGLIFTGDFLCGNRDRVRLGALFPTSSVPAYLDGARELLRRWEGELLFGAHFDPFPAMDGSTILDLITAGRGLRASPHVLPL